MSERARIDALRFAREGGRRSGEVAVADMPRLDDMLAERAGSVHYSLAGAADEQGRPTLDVHVHGTIPLVCQRCLERLDFELERASHLVLVPDGAELPDVSQEALDSETIRASEVADIRDLIEQETVLGLPLAPVHEQGCSKVESPSEERDASPFAVLKSLRRT
jgi:uncharacterized protein